MLDRRHVPRALGALALCALAVGILWSLQAATAVEAYDEVSRADPWSERGAFTHAPLLADGSGELPMGEPGYFTTDAPRVRVGFEWTLDDPRAERVAAVGDLALVVRHDKPAWSERIPLAEGTYNGAADGALVLSGEADLLAARARIEDVPGRDAGAARWAFVATIRSASGADAAESTFELPFAFTPPLYTLPGASDASTTKEHANEVVTHHDAPSPLAALAARPAGPALAGLGAVGLLFALRDRQEALA